MGNISMFTLLHNYLNGLVVFIDYSVFVAHNLFIVEVPQNINFIDKLLTFFLIHFILNNFFPHIYFVGFYGFYFNY